MVNEDEIRLASPIVVPRTDEGSDSPGDGGQNDTFQQGQDTDGGAQEADTPQDSNAPQQSDNAGDSSDDSNGGSNGGSVGSQIGGEKTGEGAEEGEAAADDQQSEENEDKADGEDMSDLLNLPERVRQDQNGKDGTQQPWGIQIDADSGWLWGGLALAVVLAACAVVEHIRRKNRKKKRRAARAAAAAAYVTGGSVAVADYQDIGAREDQQDSHEYSHPDFYAQQGVMAVVADGMGGLANGKAVSSALVRTFIDGFPQVSGYYSQTADILLDLSIRANARVNQMLRGADRSGSTLVAALVRDGYLHFLTVGDSRIYLYRGGALLQLNREHIYQEELAVKAVNQNVSLSQVRSDRQAHSLTSYFGIGHIPSVDRNDEGIRLVPGDRILLASDGVFGTLSREQMEQALQLEIQAAADRMGQMIRSEDKPHQDNNTLIIMEYKG